MSGLPVIDLSLGGVTARCYASDVYLELMKEAENGDSVTKNVPLNVPLTERQKNIIDLITKDHQITASLIAEKMGVTDKTIKRDLEELKQRNIIKRSGARKNGSWEIVQGEENE